MAEPAARVAIVSTPRSGNTWLRGMLSRVYQLQEVAIHAPDELDWDALGPRCVVQIHWRRTADFVERLDRHGFRVVVLARHPLDVLISALNYTYYAHEREGCTVEPPCMSCSILDATPRSEAFLSYCCGWPGERSLGYSLDWWPTPGIHRVRYEGLVENTAETLGRLVDSLDLDARRPVDEAVQDYDMGRLRHVQDVWHYHYWQGRPGLWRRLLPAAEAGRIAAANEAAFGALNYACDPDPALTDLQADLNWFQLQHAAMRTHLRDEQQKHRRTRAERDEARSRLAAAEAELAAAPARGAAVRVDAGEPPRPASGLVATLRGLAGRAPRG